MSCDGAIIMHMLIVIRNNVNANAQCTSVIIQVIIAILHTSPLNSCYVPLAQCYGLLNKDKGLYTVCYSFIITGTHI